MALGHFTGVVFGPAALVGDKVAVDFFGPPGHPASLRGSWHTPGVPPQATHRFDFTHQEQVVPGETRLHDADVCFSGHFLKAIASGHFKDVGVRAAVGEAVATGFSCPASMVGATVGVGFFGPPGHPASLRGSWHTPGVPPQATHRFDFTHQEQVVPGETRLHDADVRFRWQALKAIASGHFKDVGVWVAVGLAVVGGFVCKHFHALFPTLV